MPAAGREKDIARLLRLLERGDAVCRPAAREGKILVEAGGITLAADGETLAYMARAGLVVRKGKALRIAHRPQAGAAPGRELEERRVEIGGTWETVVVNVSESPLAGLYRRRNRDGEPFLAPAEFRAGERLRADYTRGQIMARIGMNWELSAAASVSGPDVNGKADLTDAALAARRRVENAMAAVGPELSGVLLDICCFLKGLEQVEGERRWPRRSAKIMLKSGLAALARHYWPQGEGPNAAASRGIVHWGGKGYRPRIA